ncbi:MAG: hypothetical protein FK734_09815 [Asgard group archaeon]|nr:hypothetical protein [Asgard group archaeon]
MTIFFQNVNAKEILTIDDNNFEVVQTYWGTPTNTQDVGPADQKVTLNIVIQNLGSKSYLGIQGTLELDQSFSNSTGGDSATAFFNGQLAVGQTTTLQFILNIAKDANLGKHQITMILSYIIPEVPNYKYAEEEILVPIYILGKVEFEVSINPEIFYPGVNNFSAIISNKGSGTAFSVNIELNLPTNLPLLGNDNNWFFNSIASGKNQNISSMLFIDSSYKGSLIGIGVLINYIDSYGSSKTISRNLGIRVASPIQDFLTVFVDQNILNVGVINEPLIKIINTGKDTISSVIISLSIPSSATGSSPLVFLSNNEWHFTSLGAEEMLSFSPKILPVLGSIDNSYQVQISISYIDKNGVLDTESKFIGFNLQGKIVFIFLNEQVNPSSISPDEMFSISGDMINIGTTRALYASLEIENSTIFSSLSDSTYIGEIDVNVPTPYSISLKVNEHTQNGTFYLNLFFTYFDDYGEKFSFKRPITIIVGGSEDEPPIPSNSESNNSSFFELIQPFILPVAVVAIAFVLLFYLIRRRSKSQPK